MDGKEAGKESFTTICLTNIGFFLRIIFLVPKLLLNNLSVCTLIIAFVRCASAIPNARVSFSTRAGTMPFWPATEPFKPSYRRGCYPTTPFLTLRLYAFLDRIRRISSRQGIYLIPPIP